jgi:hypothetical protein
MVLNDILLYRRGDEMPERVSLSDAEKYYCQGLEVTDETIQKILQNSPKAIVHGGRATNAQLPKCLNKPTEDWDIFVSADAKAAAAKIEQALDERYGSNFFEVKPALHPGTYRIMNKVTQRAVADITIPERHIPFKKLMNGVNYATLDYHVEQIKLTFTLPEKKFRWPKDSETLQRIDVYKKMISKGDDYSDVF